MQQIILIIFSSSVIGGVVVALINWYRAERTAKKERKIKFLDEQIRNLYGPLYYLVSQNDRLFELYNRYHEAYNEAPSLEDPKAVIEKANEYINEVYKNNEKIKNLLDSNSSLIDPDDNELFLLFYEHYTRLKIELDEEGKSIIPPPILKKLGMISILKPEVIDRIKKKFFEKKEQLDSLRGKLKGEHNFVRKGGQFMRTYFKYLIIGWTVFSIVILSFLYQISKQNFIKEDYRIYLYSKDIPDKKMKARYYLAELFDELYFEDDELLGKEEFIQRIKGVKNIEGILMKDETNIDNTIYILLPVVAFVIWSFPILVFSLLGIIFIKKD